MSNKNHFSLLNIIIIVIVTAIISAITTGVILMNNTRTSSGLSYGELMNDKNLEEFLNIYATVLSEYYEDVDKGAMIDSAISGMLSYLGDSYTTYLDKDQSENLAKQLEGTYNGIGITIQSDGLVVQKVTENSPADKAGIKAGDILLTVNGNDLTGKSSSYVAAAIQSSDKTISITVKRNTTVLSFNIDKAVLTYPSISYKMIEGTKIGYLEISIFSNTLSDQVKSALNDLNNEGMEKLIIDVRDDSGGYLSACESVCEMFLEKGKIIYSLEDKEDDTVYRDETDESKSYQIVVLINENSASASEILAAALKDSYGATLVGSKSYGKGKVQQTVSLSDGSMAKYTSAKWLRPNGTCIDGIGITPDYVVENQIIYNSDGVTVNSVVDNQLEKAIEIMKVN